MLEFEFNDSENDDPTVHKLSTKALISLVVLSSSDLIELAKLSGYNL